MKRITVIKRGQYSYIAFKDSCPFEWATGASKAGAFHNLKNKYPSLINEDIYTYKNIYERTN